MKIARALVALIVVAMVGSVLVSLLTPAPIEGGFDKSPLNTPTGTWEPYSTPHPLGSVVVGTPWATPINPPRLTVTSQPPTIIPPGYDSGVAGMSATGEPDPRSDAPLDSSRVTQKPHAVPDTGSELPFDFFSLFGDDSIPTLKPSIEGFGPLPPPGSDYVPQTLSPSSPNVPTAMPTHQPWPPTISYYAANDNHRLEDNPIGVGWYAYPEYPGYGWHGLEYYFWEYFNIDYPFSEAFEEPYFYPRLLWLGGLNDWTDQAYTDTPNLFYVEAENPTFIDVCWIVQTDEPECVYPQYDVMEGYLMIRRIVGGEETIPFRFMSLYNNDAWVFGEGEYQQNEWWCSRFPFDGGFFYGSDLLGLLFGSTNDARPNTNTSFFFQPMTMWTTQVTEIRALLPQIRNEEPPALDPQP
jgi:hypothetical protein